MLLDLNVQGVEMPDVNKAFLGKWIAAVARAHNKKVGNITYIFTDDEGILAVNREFLNHDYYTDIITFDYSRRHTIAGDIYISLDTVASNAELVEATYENELRRVLIHGILHLCGINDKGPGEREIMEAHENEALKLYDELQDTPD